MWVMVDKPKDSVQWSMGTGSTTKRTQKYEGQLTQYLSTKWHACGTHIYKQISKILNLLHLYSVSLALLAKHTYIHTNTYVHTKTHTTYIHTHIHTHIYTNIHTHIHTYIHTHRYIHIHIHTHPAVIGYMAFAGVQIQGLFLMNSNGPGGTSGAHTTCCEERPVLL